MSDHRKEDEFISRILHGTVEKRTAYLEPTHRCTDRMRDMAECAARRYGVWTVNSKTFTGGYPQILILNLDKEEENKNGYYYESDSDFLENVLYRDRTKNIVELYIEQRGKEINMKKLEKFFDVVKLQLNDEKYDIVDISAEEESENSSEEEKKPKDSIKELVKTKKMSKSEIEIREAN